MSSTITSGRDLGKARNASAAVATTTGSWPIARSARDSTERRAGSSSHTPTTGTPGA